MKILKIISSFWGLLSLGESVLGANILVVTLLASKSQNLVMSPLFTGLAQRGHKLTIISPHKYTNENITSISGMYAGGKLPSLFELRAEFKRRWFGSFWNPFAIGSIFEDNCRSYYENPAVQKILNDQRNNFDLIFTSSIFGECGYGIVSVINAPSILICPVGGDPWTYQGFGAPSLPSFNPFVFSKFSHDMSFPERISNVLIHTYFWAYYNYVYAPWMERVYKEYLGEETLGVNQVSRNFSLLFLDTHVSTHYPRLLMQDMIPIGGLNLKPSIPLPNDLELICGKSAAPHGFIYFSLGSLIPTKDMPQNVVRIFTNVFSRLKQKVLWKWDSDGGIDNLPSNVHLSKWLPQQDLLGHENIKLFITHGGLGSVKEAAYHGVPLLGMPIFADQDTNMAFVENSGFGKVLEYTEISEQLLESLINDLLQDKRYTNQAQKYSRIFRDQPENSNPLEKALYWTEYVIRHNGAEHFRSPARDMNILTYYSIDTFGFLFIISFLCIYFIAKLFSKFINAITTTLCKEKFTKKQKTL